MKTKDSNSRFIFVNSDELIRPTYIVKREFSFNDFDNVYYKTGEETLDTIFEEYEIPKEFRKVAFKINSPLLFKRLVEDYITKIEYSITSDKVDDKLLISGQTKSAFFYETFNFKSFPIFVSYEELLLFYKQLREKGILENYIKAISNFYRINDITKNIEKYNSIMAQYRNGKFGAESLTLYEILSFANEKDLIKQMSLYELQYLVDNSSSNTKMLFIEEIKSRLSSSKKDKSIVKVLNKN